MQQNGTGSSSHTTFLYSDMLNNTSGQDAWLHVNRNISKIFIFVSYVTSLLENRIFSACKRSQCLPVYSPRISLDMMTVKMGAELFTVSAKDTATFFRLTKPKTTVVNLTDTDKDYATAGAASVFVNLFSSLCYFLRGY